MCLSRGVDGRNGVSTDSLTCMGNGGEVVPSGSVSVDLDAIAEISRHLRGVADTLHTALESTAGDVAGLATGGTSGTWNGDAAVVFSEGWTNVREGGMQIISSLMNLAEQLGITADSYRNNEVANAYELQRLSSQVDMS